MEVTLETLQEKAVAFRDERDWEQFHQPKDLALALQVEAAELAELFLWKTREECEAVLDDEKSRSRLEEELADVQIYLLYLAEVAGVSLSEAVVSKLEMNGKKYPVEKSRGSAKKYTELE